MDKEIREIIKCDSRLITIMDFVCKMLDITPKDFTSLALANLLEEELEWIQQNSNRLNKRSLEKIKHFTTIVKEVKMETSFILNRN